MFVDFPLLCTAAGNGLLFPPGTRIKSKYLDLKVHSTHATGLLDIQNFQTFCICLECQESLLLYQIVICFPHACDIGLVVRMSADTFHDKQTYKTESFYFIEKFTFAKHSFVKPWSSNDVPEADPFQQTCFASQQQQPTR